MHIHIGSAGYKADKVAGAAQPRKGPCGGPAQLPVVVQQGSVQIQAKKSSLHCAAAP